MLDAGGNRGNGKVEKAEAILQRSRQTIQQIRKEANFSWFISPLHILAHLRGWFDSSAMRKPLPSPTMEQIEVVRKCLREYDALS